MIKRIAYTALVTTFLILSSSLIYVGHVEAEVNRTSYMIEWVNHKVEVMYNGYIFVNDTIKISGAMPAHFPIGFPYQYGPYVIQCVAYNPLDQSEKYSVTYNVSLEDRADIYGVKIELPNKGSPQIFTVGFVLSNSLLKQDAQNTSLFTLGFPAYPSLETTVLACNSSVVLPKSAKYVNGTIASFDYAENMELPAFTYEPANVTFTLAEDELQLFVVKELKQEILIGGTGEIQVSDQYYIRNLSPKSITSINVILPSNASAIIAEDEFGRKPKTSPTLVNAESNNYKISLMLPVESNRSTIFVVKYTLPRDVYLTHDSSSLELVLPTFKNLNYYIEKAYFTFVLPEGARITMVNCDGSDDLTCDVIQDIFKEKATVIGVGMFSLNSFTVKIAYEYNLLWLSFRPTLWIWTAAIFGCVIVALVKKSKAPVSVALPVQKEVVRLTPETIKSFIDSYEEKRKIISEMKSLEAGIRRGRIPRRRYKVQRRNLELRLTSVSRALEALKQKLRAVGGRYVDLMNQLDKAEAEAGDAEANIKNIETRHNRGEISLEAYRKLLSEYERKKESAEANISGILVRLREEMH